MFIHNLKGYDEHLIIDAFGKYGKYIERKTETLEDDDGSPYESIEEKEKSMKIACISNSAEKYMKIRLGRCNFNIRLDSKHLF